MELCGVRRGSLCVRSCYWDVRKGLWVPEGFFVSEGVCRVSDGAVGC